MNPLLEKIEDALEDQLEAADPESEENAPAKMDDTELEAMMGAEITDAVSYIDSDLSPIRARGTEVLPWRPVRQ